MVGKRSENGLEKEMIIFAKNILLKLLEFSDHTMKKIMFWPHVLPTSNQM